MLLVFPSVFIGMFYRFGGGKTPFIWCYSFLHVMLGARNFSYFHLCNCCMEYTLSPLDVKSQNRTRFQMNILKSIVRVTLSNIVVLISSLVLGFIIPMIISLEGYGYYKVFSLYGPYFVLLNLGLIDGVGLKFGDKNYDELNKEKFRTYFQQYLIIHCFFISILAPLIYIKAKGEYRFIFFGLIINILAVNITGYFQHISQITQRFKEFSNRKIVQALLNLLIIGLLLLAQKYTENVTYRLYVMMLIFTNYLMMFWYSYTYKDLILGKSSSLQSSLLECIEFIKQGFPLVFSYQIATLILSLDRQFVSILFPTVIYATYAFAYSMLAIISTATSAVSAVLFPTIKRMNLENLKRQYSRIIGLFFVFIFAMLSIYFPLTLLIKIILPKYLDSLPIFRIILPGFVISSSITVIIHNYYKVLEQNRVYFFKSIVVLAISLIANLIAYSLFKSTNSISIASVITIFIWFFYFEHHLKRFCQHIGNRHHIYMFVMTSVFYLVSTLDNYITGFFLYISLLVIISVIVFNRSLFVTENNKVIK